VRSLRLETSARKSGEGFTPVSGFERLCNIQNILFMSVYQKQNLQVQFLKFGVDHNGIIVPILKRGKDHFVQLPPVAKRANAQDKNTPPSR